MKTVLSSHETLFFFPDPTSLQVFSDHISKWPFVLAELLYLPALCSHVPTQGWAGETLPEPGSTGSRKTKQESKQKTQPSPRCCLWFFNKVLVVYKLFFFPIVWINIHGFKKGTKSIAQLSVLFVFWCHCLFVVVSSVGFYSTLQHLQHGLHTGNQCMLLYRRQNSNSLSVCLYTQ